MNRHTQLKDIASGSLQSPRIGEPERDAINSIIDGGVQILCEKITELQTRMEELKQQALNRAADAKALLNETVSVYAKISDEIAHATIVLAEIEARGRDE